MSQPAEIVWKQQLQRVDLLCWVFQRCYSPVSYNFFVRFQFLSPGNDFSFCWWFVGPNDPQIYLLLQNWYALWVSLWTFVFFFYSKNSAFHYLSLAILFFWTYTFNMCQCVLVISKAWKVLQTLLGPSPNVFWNSFLRITGVELARKAKTFSFSSKKISSWRKNSCKINPQPCQMDDSEYSKIYGCKTTELKICPKRETIPKFLGRKKGFFSKLGFLNSTCRFLKFMILFREKI